MLNVDGNVTFVKFYIVPLINELFYDLMVKVILLFVILKITYNLPKRFVKKKKVNKIYNICVYSRLLALKFFTQTFFYTILFTGI